MNYKVSVASNSYSIKQKSNSNYKVNAIIGGQEVASLSDLDDVNTSGAQNGFVLMYNSATGQFTPVDPDNVLSNSTNTNSGLPQDFIDQLDVQLDDKIDLDGGGF